MRSKKDSGPASVRLSTTHPSRIWHRTSHGPSRTLHRIGPDQAENRDARAAFAFSRPPVGGAAGPDAAPRREGSRRHPRRRRACRPRNTRGPATRRHRPPRGCAGARWASPRIRSGCAGRGGQAPGRRALAAGRHGDPGAGGQRRRSPDSPMPGPFRARPLPGSGIPARSVPRRLVARGPSWRGFSGWGSAYGRPAGKTLSNLEPRLAHSWPSWHAGPASAIRPVRPPPRTARLVERPRPPAARGRGAARSPHVGGPPGLDRHGGAAGSRKLRPRTGRRYHSRVSRPPPPGRGLRFCGLTYAQLVTSGAEPLRWETDRPPGAAARGRGPRSRRDCARVPRRRWHGRCCALLACACHTGSSSCAEARRESFKPSRTTSIAGRREPGRSGIAGNGSAAS